MNKRSSDTAIGAFVVAAFGLLIWAVSGFRGLAFVALMLITGGVVIRLFESPSKWSKAFAILLLPALLLTYLKPKKKSPSEDEQP
jgi:hypothetical protein